MILSRTVDKKMFSYQGRNLDLQLYLHTIKYIYKDKTDRKVNIVTETSTFSVSLSLREISQLLDDRFKMVHRSCIVNTDKVVTYDWSKSKIILKDGTEVNYLSRKYKSEVER